MKFPLLLAFGITLWVGTAQAQEQLAKNAVQTSAEDSKAFDEAKKLVHLTRLWSKPLDWNETGSSTADIVAHLKQALGNDAPIIEVRGKDTNRSTFVMKGALLGPTLTAVADLANMAVWVFPERLLLAPEAALSPAERSAVKEWTGGEWKHSSAAQGKGWNPRPTMENMGVAIVGSEVKARIAAKGGTVPAKGEPVRVGIPEPHLPYELPFRELSPSVQTVMQALVHARSGNFSASTYPQIESSAIVGFDDTKPDGHPTELRLEVIKVDAPRGRQDLGRWYVNKPRPPFLQQPN